MTARIAGLLLALAAGITGGYFIGTIIGMAVCVALSAIAWMAVDALRGVRVLRWLRTAEPLSAPDMIGLWGEVVDRARKQLRLREQAVSESQLRLQEFLAAIQASPNGVVLIDAQGRIEWSNQTAADQLGIDPRRDLLQHIGNLVRDPVFTGYLSSGDFSAAVTLQAPQSLSIRPQRLSLQLHPYGDGRKLLLTRDITQLEQAEAMRRDFVANVSHEIRTPLTVLSGFIETLQSLKLTEDERTRYLELMAQQSLRMQTLVSDLLTLSRLEGSPPPDMAQHLDVTVLLSQCEQEAQALSHGLHRIVFSQDAACELMGAANELQSAMSNLVSNAVRYTPAGGQITVRWRTGTDGRGEFSVQDTGPGIAAEHIPRLTERFYRVDRSRSRETGGTGLGLAIVKHVAQRHGAELRIESDPGKGSCFTLLFPLARTRAVGQALRPELRADAVNGARTPSPASEQR